MLGQARNLIVARHGVHRHMHAHAMVMRELHSLGQLLGRKVARKRAHAEARTRKVHRVRAVEHGHLQLFHIARRGEDLRFSSHTVPLSKRQHGLRHAAASVFVILRTGWS